MEQPRRQRATVGQIHKRVELIINMVLDGHAASVICRNMSEKWQVSTRQVDRYIRVANKKIKENSERSTRTSFNWHVAARKRNLQRAVADRDWSLVMKQLRDIADMEGRYPKRRVELLDKVTPSTPAEIKTGLERIAEQEGLTLDEFCAKERIDLSLLEGGGDGNENAA